MGLVDINVKELADEAAKVLPPALEPILHSAIDKLIADLRGLLVGRKITITIE